MPPYADHTWDEIHSQPAAWRATLADTLAQSPAIRAFLAGRRGGPALVTGCGSAYYVSMAAAAALREVAGIRAEALPASTIWLSPELAYAGGPPPPLVAFSRSGATSETLRAVEGHRARGGAVLTLSCYAEQALAQLGDLNLVLTAGQERSIAQTRAFSSLYVAALAVAAIGAGRDDLLAALARLPAAGQAVLDRAGPPARALAARDDLSRCFVLGAGARHSLACEISLKLKEMSLSVSEPFHVLEYRHGPQAMAGPETLIIGLRSTANAAHEEAVLAEMRRFGATTFTVGAGESDLPLPGDLPEPICGPLYLPFGQLLAYERAVRRGLDPDRPHQLSDVVRLDP